MDIKKLKKLIADALSDYDDICSILNSDSSLLISSIDGSNFLVNILESKRTLIHRDREEKAVQEYLTTHLEEDFAKDILNMVNEHPGFFVCFMLFTKLEEMEIIDRGLFYHLNDSVVRYEDEVSLFIAELLGHFSINNEETDG